MASPEPAWCMLIKCRWGMSQINADQPAPAELYTAPHAQANKCASLLRIAGPPFQDSLDFPVANMRMLSARHMCAPLGFMT